MEPAMQRYEELMVVLRTRFEHFAHRHEGIAWEDVRERLVSHQEKMRSLWEMESTGGEPDVVGYDPGTQSYMFFDCARESPPGRRNVCYDREAQLSRKRNAPAHNAADMAAAMGAELMSEQDYRMLQRLGSFDTRTSSWLKTPPEIRNLGGALFGDRRYGRVFVYHNSAQSYFSSRGFRCKLQV